MERIKEAIEKAKQQRGGEPAKAYKPVVAGVNSAAADNVPDILEALSYEQTRVVNLESRHLERNRIVALNKSNQACWAIDLLRTKLLQKMDENGWRTIAIVSPTAEAGKSVVGINLAISIAHSTQKTSMLVDLDLRRPKIAKYLGLHVDKSLNDYLEGNAGLSEVLVNPGIPRLVILPTNKPVRRSAELMTSRKIEEMIEDLRNRYSSRIVIFDLPPLLNVDDTIAVLPKLDCVLLVIGNGMSGETEIKEAAQHLAHANLLGVVLNKADVEIRSYAY